MAFVNWDILDSGNDVFSVPLPEPMTICKMDPQEQTSEI